MAASKRGLEVAERSRKPLVQQIKELHEETAALCQSEIACELSDAYVEMNKRLRDTKSSEAKLAFDVNLQRLERATRTSKLRKVLR